MLPSWLSLLNTPIAIGIGFASVLAILVQEDFALMMVVQRNRPDPRRLDQQPALITGGSPTLFAPGLCLVGCGLPLHPTSGRY